MKIPRIDAGCNDHALRHCVSRMNALQNSHFSTNRRALRSGLTLLEVLIAIGVLTIGLLGLLAIVPLVASRFRDSDIAERKSTLGRNWSEEFIARRYSNPSLWVFTNPAGTSANIDGVSVDRLETAGVTFVARQPVLIDPWIATRNGLTVTTFPSNASVPGPPTNLRPNSPFAIWRLSLAGMQSLPNPQAVALADSIFTTSDELEQIFPDKRGDPVNPVFVPEPTAYPAGTITTSSRRLSAQRFSWAAMLVPINSYVGGDNNPRYRLSTIVYQDREIDPTLSEVVGQVTSFGSSGIQGGDVTIGTIGGTPGSIGTIIREGQWILLSGVIRHPVPPGTTGTKFTSLHRWYQVVQADPNPDTDPTVQQTVTLLGSDWPAGGTCCSDGERCHHDDASHISDRRRCRGGTDDHAGTGFVGLVGHPVIIKTVVTRRFLLRFDVINGSRG